MAKPTYHEFCMAYYTIMEYIDTEPNSRQLFHALLTFRLNKSKEIHGDEE